MNIIWLSHFVFQFIFSNLVDALVSMHLAKLNMLNAWRQPNNPLEILIDINDLY